MEDNNVLDMIRELAAETGSEATEDIFKRKPEPAPVVVKPITKPDTEWKPSDDIIGDMDELKRDSVGVVYDSSVIGDKIDTTIRNISDDVAAQAAMDTMDELSRARYNIDRAKAHLGIDKLKIPEFYHSKFIDVATDNNAERALQNTMAILKEMITVDPSVIISRLETTTSVPVSEVGVAVNSSPIIDDGTDGDWNAYTGGTDTGTPNDDTTTESDTIPTVQIVIDKTQASDVSFSEDEKDKIRRSRSVELKIVEERELHYSVISEPENDIDAVLSQYTRKFNDRSVSLPASRYRCTVTGLTYTEVIDLNYSMEMNSLDGEKKKWSIAYDHIRNASIGPFIDFDDFLSKTSYLDLDFLIWAILCCTCMSKEIVSIDCNQNGCNETYDWVYEPSALLQLNRIPETVLDEMKETGEANTSDEIERVYGSSLLRQASSVTLPNSKFIVCFGHISAKRYLDTVYGTQEEARKAVTDGNVPSSFLHAMMLSVVKYILLPDKSSDSYYKIEKAESISKVLNQLDEVDYQAIIQLMDSVTVPYQVQFSINDVVCPKCKHKSNVSVPDIANLLFLMTRGISSTNVVLKRQ